MSSANDSTSTRVPQDPPGSPPSAVPPRRSNARPPAVSVPNPDTQGFLNAGTLFAQLLAAATPYATTNNGAPTGLIDRAVSGFQAALPAIPGVTPAATGIPTGIFFGLTPGPTLDDEISSVAFGSTDAPVPAADPTAVPSAADDVAPAVPPPAPAVDQSIINQALATLISLGFNISGPADASAAVPPAADPSIAAPSAAAPSAAAPPASGPPLVPTGLLQPVPGHVPSFAPSESASGSYDVPKSGSSLFPDAISGSFRREPRASTRTARVRLSKHDRGAPGSKEYNINVDKITKAPRSGFKFDYVEVDTLSNPSKFNQELASSVTAYATSLAQLLAHCQQYDLMFPLMVPTTVQPNGVVSNTTKNLLHFHGQFDAEHIHTWQFLLNHQCIDPVDNDTNRLLEDHFMNCLTGRLLTEVTAEFRDLDESVQGSATLIFMALRKLHSNSASCIAAQQGFIMYFDLSKIKYEDVSLAVSWLKATTSNLSYSNDIPNKAVGFILAGMSRSHNRAFNTFCSVLECQQIQPTGYTSSVVDPLVLCKSVHSVLDSLNDKYRDILQHGRWLKAKPIGSSSHSTFVATPSAASRGRGGSLGSHHQPPNPPDLALQITPDVVQALFSQYGVRQCFNPNCRSVDHVAKDCPIAFPANWDPPRRTRGRSRDRKSGNTSSSRGNSVSSKGSRGTSNDKTRAPTPHGKKSALNSKAVAFKQAYNVSVEVADSTSDAGSDFSAYDSTYASAYLLRQDVDESSKE